ncbi:MAG: hypothetical protein K2N88_05510 [Muribaculaceae bacterium]|nr:hypothetical protein [Muribaculaceae bacterium]
MKKISIILGMAALALGFTSCSQEEDPKFHVPTDFIVSTPALQNVEFETSDDLTDAATFNLFCSQPDYGYSAICSYAAFVSLDPECPVEKVIDEATGDVSYKAVSGKSVLLENSTPASAAMTFKTYDLGIALQTVAGVLNDKDAFDASTLATTPQKAYFRAVCSIPGIANSSIVSSNVVSYNAVKVQYAERLPGWVYILGNVANPETGVDNAFTAPSASNYSLYENFRLYEPDNMIGEKIYVGRFNIMPKSETPDMENVDDTSQFRIMTDLLGWVPTASYGSAEGDFYSLPIQDKFFGSGYAGPVVAQGLGNWGIWVSTPTPATIVFDLTSLQIYIHEGFHEVTFTGREPKFGE